MEWKIAQAKEKFSQLIQEAGKEPQLIYNREKEVAAVISIDEYRDYMKLKEDYKAGSVGKQFSLLRDICQNENYTIEVPEREDRSQEFPDVSL